MDLAGTKSLQNVKAALQGESLAQSKYTLYARQAKQEGHQDIAQLFDIMAENERQHAKVWLKMLDGIGDTLTNLISAASKENEEWKTMYPAFAAQAREEGLGALAVLFEKIAAIENDHEKRFLEAYLQLKEQKQPATAQATSTTATQTAPQAAAPSALPYRCMFCGYMAASSLDLCPLCEAMAAFEAVKQ